MKFLRVIAVCLTASTLAGAEDAHPIGIEEGTKIVLERGDYLPRPLDDRTPLIVRLGSVEKSDGGFTYQFHFIGFEPGDHRLADYLMHPDGSPAEELGDRTFHVATILPPDHDGALTPYIPSPFPWFGGYRALLWLLGIVWILGWGAFLWFGRRRNAVAEHAPEAPAPTYAERLRPYVEAAAEGKLDSAGQAELERLMTAYWRDKLGLGDQHMADELASLREHPEAGSLLRSLERWLHRPGGASPAEIETLLAPYREPTTHAGKEVMV